MSTEETVFEKTYQGYLEQLGKISLASAASRLGAQLEGNRLCIPLFQNEYRVAAEGITDGSGKKPSLDICVILSRYVLMCPDRPPKSKGWVSFKDFRDAGPLVTYFTHDVERALIECFSGKMPEFRKACDALGGYPPGLDVAYDLTARFDALPRIPMVVLYNDADAEFPASCSVLFDSTTEDYLDAESIAILGWQLCNRLKKAAA